MGSSTAGGEVPAIQNRLGASNRLAVPAVFCGLNLACVERLGTTNRECCRRATWET